MSLLWFDCKSFDCHLAHRLSCASMKHVLILENFMWQGTENSLWPTTATEELRLSIQQSVGNWTQSTATEWAWKGSCPSWKLITTLQKILKQRIQLSHIQVPDSIKDVKEKKKKGKPRDKPTHLWPTNLWQRRQEYTMEKKQPLQ